MPLPQDLLRRLYTEPPEAFVATRDAAVAEARRAGDPATAREIARLRRPTVAAWLVNLLALRRPELVADLTQLAEALRAAQRDLRGPRLRELSGQRRAAVAALVAEARRLAADAGQPAGKLPLGEVEATLNAALSDAEVAGQVRSGRLLRAASYAGFGEVPRPQLRLVTGGEEPPPAGPTAGPGRRAADRRTGRAERTGRADQADRKAGRADHADQAAREADHAAREDDHAGRAARKAGRAGRDAARATREAERAERARQRRALERELTRARADQERAEAELAGAAEAEHDGGEELAGIERALAELERRRARAEQELSRRKLARRAAERAVTAARRRTGEVEGAIEAVDAEDGAAAEGPGGAD
ncbi:hypothetical protein [Micromonospora carbonacea]|uniref:Uncharacterized protein n=1 Tax=Micromonospora carbonacea TaxID=47853 RepID=A0A7H8XGY2_9ACTN|nr:hypothetical protein [Micromonospora carbonacea]MBB5828805.1 hypothetical protein [Micromonospora carbonacea]QLD23639.1 hypothetical protein HXZ27_04955 [Micromonospora carbonacea]